MYGKNKARLESYVDKRNYTHGSPAYLWQVKREAYFTQVIRVGFTASGDWRKAVVSATDDGYELHVYDLRGQYAQESKAYKSMQTALKNGAKAAPNA